MRSSGGSAVSESHRISLHLRRERESGLDDESDEAMTERLAAVRAKVRAYVTPEKRGK